MSPLKQKFKLIFSFVLIFILKSYSQTDKVCNVVYYANDYTFIIQDSLINYESSKDSIFFKNRQFEKLSFYKNKLFLDKKKVYDFKNVESYYYIVYIESDNKEYIYIYPQYKDRWGPYAWYGLGILVEINDKQILIQKSIDYFENFEICKVLDFGYGKTIKIIPR